MLNNFKVWATIPVEDLDRAVKFYTEKLELKPSMVSKEMMVANMEAGSGTMLQLYQRAPSKADHTLATFEVSDMKRVVVGLISKGVMFENYDMGPIKTVDGIATIGSELAAWFKDSEGNILCLHETVK